MSAFSIILAHLTLLAYALVGGVFLAFSDFIMRALLLTSGRGGAEAMQRINREVFRWVFMTLFLGLAVVSVALGVYAVLRLDGPVAVLAGAAGLVYLLGCFGVTVLFNVPMNERLAWMDPARDAAGDYWTGTYLPRWDLLEHRPHDRLRRLGGVAASGAVAGRVSGGPHPPPPPMSGLDWQDWWGLCPNRQSGSGVIVRP
ncbi:anthrone oxygenase family protein [Wenxinia marina]|uniref:Putative integral membrane protein n=1 Tax=Wenxinia marina DSM 24838 TaxID=1123501 RepID=A0A0D0PIN4_9RHOB|nr:anthrone oxygenase family protein [Wenxinia marina]KIQ71196.1 putative integral membrane protein [Wenxinia marina DSM 24838]GGL81739.1 hypothetical protein GCM10011392_40420 [Wenxinia marina]